MNFSAFTLNKMINDHGVVYTLRTRVAGAYNVTTGTVTNADTDYFVKGYEYNNTVEGLSKDSIQSGVKRVCLSPVNTTGTTYPKPTTNGQLIYGKTVDIVVVKEIKSGSAVMCYILEVKD
jgi:hypothetical protein